MDSTNSDGAFNLPNLGANGIANEYLTDRLTTEAVQFIENHKNEPFFLYMSHYAVHTPIQAKADLKAKYQLKLDNATPQELAAFAGHTNPTYAAMLESMDQSLGQIMDKLQTTGLENNTVIIFASDNGGLDGAQANPTDNAPLAEGKGSMYEGGIRSPMLVKWPGKTIPQSVTDAVVTTYDFYPTILDIIQLPGNSIQNQSMDGKSFKSMLTQPDAVDPDRTIYWHYPHYSDQHLNNPNNVTGGKPASAIRKGDWKLIWFYESPSAELYNLANDISESNNMAGSNPAKANELITDLRNWLITTNAQMPIDKSAGTPTPLPQ